MSDSKRTGNRDISDLKARLGLKKGAAGAAGTGQTTARAGTTGGVVPPPGLNLPPPPGVQPAQPAIPNAADDPFGAMNAMAVHGNVHRAPEIVIVNDGKPVENVGTQSMGATIAKIAVPAVLALGIGVGIGRISKAANFYNDGLDDAGEILGAPDKPSTVKATKKLLADLDNQLDAMSKSGYRPDPAATKALSDMVTKLDVKSKAVFQAKQNALDDGIAGEVLAFYAGVAEIRGMLDIHVKAAKADDKMLAVAKQKTDDATLKDGENQLLAGQARYGVLLSAPTEQDKDDFGARLVELGPVFCGDKQSSTGKCEEGAPSAFGYRNDPGGIAWQKGDLVTSGEDSVPTKKLVMLLPNGVRDALIKGGEPGASEAFYVKRLRTVSERTKKLITDANKLESQLQSVTNKGRRFSFFL
ncbi:MAG TPA: hypothetical protein VK427_22490 [Kofleriaceae bacterium]|nr:hypothetical protein [Kofleriaceae bacterium]